MTKDQAKTILYEIGDQLKSLSYADLKKLDHDLPYASDADEWRLFREVLVGTQKLEMHILIGEWGLRRRISVELIALSDDGPIGPDNIGCVYFERFSSGRLNEGIDAVAIIIGVGVIALIAALIASVW